MSRRWVGPEERGFSPHLTLGRVIKGVSPTVEAAVGQMVERSVVEQIGVQRVTAVNLIASDLRPTGAVYTTLVSVPLPDAVSVENVGHYQATSESSDS